MDVEIKEKENRRHVGRNLQRIRVYLGMKQEALAADLGVNQQENGFITDSMFHFTSLLICRFKIHAHRKKAF